MHKFHPSAPPRRRRGGGFTLVEIMVAVVIIGILAMLVMPALQKSRLASANNRFISDLRVFAQAFESYSVLNGGWPPNAGSGTVPAGMDGEIRHANWSKTNSVGGLWNWDNNNFGITAGISTTGVTHTDAQMMAIDRRIDDGDLTTGLFQKIGSRFTYILEN
ncbi:MAG: type II secretion system protein [Opitutaceae bacterium]|nr:type II secretion system protein [Opitutaceae bacterium]